MESPINPQMTQANPNPPLISSWLLAGIFSVLLFAACIGLGMIVKPKHRQALERKAVAAATMAELERQISAETAKSDSLDAVVAQAGKAVEDEARPAMEKVKQEHAAAVAKQKKETAAAIAGIEQEKARLIKERDALEASQESAEYSKNTVEEQVTSMKWELQKMQAAGK